MTSTRVTGGNFEILDCATQASAEYARRRVQRAIQRSAEPITAIRVRLSRHPEQGAEPVLAQAALDVGGRVVRLQARGASEHDAINALEARIQARLDRLAGLTWAEPRPYRPSAHTSPAEARHEAAGQTHPPYEPIQPVQPGSGPAASGPIRHKVVVLEICSIDEAIAEMEYLDHRFELFIERGTGCESLVRGDVLRGYHLQQIHRKVPGETAELEQHELTVILDEEPVPSMAPEDSVAEIARRGIPHLFFLDERRGRGCVVYRRDDGTWGELIAVN